MASPSRGVLQRWAEKYAAKLGLNEAVKVAPARDCPDGGEWGRRTHGHMTLHRGLICWATASQNKLAAWWLKHRGWKALLAHEVCHLKVKDHNSPYFARWMAKLGFRQEKRVAQVAGLLRHRHQWAPESFRDGHVQHVCRLCPAMQEGTITWGRPKTQGR